ncbi:MAG: hypothetical protein COZ01_03930 [Zetaproteobacteria bacterium CG_4_10_14_0_8_um_filter_55_43]|nr:MAG: hypothetical protein COZ01_03930 [Zetaproteobacteria bacterium CG_4_10_14_0_8_um_filter_55_43]
MEIAMRLRDIAEEPGNEEFAIQVDELSSELSDLQLKIANLLSENLVIREKNDALSGKPPSWAGEIYPSEEETLGCCR